MDLSLTTTFSQIQNLDSSGWSQFSSHDHLVDEMAQESAKYPIFIRLKTYIDSGDVMWNQTLTNAANGKFPKYIKYNDDTKILNYDHKRYHHKIRLDDDDLVATKQVTDFFKKHAQMWSQKEIQEASSIKTASNLKWTLNLSQEHRNNLLSKFVKRQCRVRGLDIKRYHDITLSKINIGVASGVIKNDDIEMSDNSIKRIKNLEWDDKNKYFYFKKNNWLNWSSNSVLKDTMIAEEPQYFNKCNIDNLIKKINRDYVKTMRSK